MSELIASHMAHHEHWSVYALVLEPREKEFLIKIGYSSDPIARVSEMFPALPYEPSLIWTPKLAKKNCQNLERDLHGRFKAMNTRGEWFLFSMEHKQLFNKQVAHCWSICSSKTFKWRTLSRKDLVIEIKKYQKSPAQRRLVRQAQD